MKLEDDVINISGIRGYIWFSSLNIIFCLWLFYRGGEGLERYLVSDTLHILYLWIIVQSCLSVLLVIMISKHKSNILNALFLLVTLIQGILWSCVLYYLVEHYNNPLVMLSLITTMLLPAIIAFYISTSLLILFTAPVIITLILLEVTSFDSFTTSQFAGTAVILLVLFTARYIMREWYLKSKLSEHENKKLIEKLQQMAEHDSLTGLKNRHSMKTFFDRITNNQSPGSAVYIIAMDIDFFKQYNDIYGHVAGDDCLTRFAECIKNSIRGSVDGSFRFGGEEFIVIMSGKEYPPPEHVIERIRKNLANQELQHKGSEVSEFVTFSAGIAKYEASISLENLLVRADQALYDAKRKGRNRTVIWSDEKFKNDRGGE